MRQYRILIVDDEPHVINMLIGLLEKTGEDFDILYANNGQDALEIIKKGRIDVLVTDIQMPGMNGVELVRAANSFWVNSRVIFFTAYPEFSYAYEAFKENAADYILKTESDAYIADKILAVCRSADIVVNNGAAPADDDGSIDRLLFSEAETECDALKDIGFNLGQPIVLLAGSGRGPGLERMVYTHLEKLYTKMIFGSDARGRLIAAFQLKDNGADGWVSGILETVQNAHASLSGKKASFTYAVSEGPDYGLRALIKPVLDRLDTQDDSGAPWVFKLKNEFASHEGINRNKLERLEYYFINALKIISLAKRQDLSAKEDILGELSELFYPLRLEHLTAIEEKTRRKFEDGQTCGARNTIRFIKNYIADNLANDVSLMKLSEATGYNCSYLSWLFHKHEGAKLSRYINKKKMEFIDSYLKDNSITIENVMRRTGFNSRRYFNIFIKRETGMSPKEYRASLMNEK